MKNSTDLEVYVSAYAEISKEYINQFPDQECVQQYLKTVSEKAGAELISHCNDSKDKTFTVKGPWLSVNRARLFLQTFLDTFDGDEVHNVNSENHNRGDNDANINDNDFQVDLPLEFNKCIKKLIPKPIVIYDGLEKANIKDSPYRQPSLAKIGSAFRNAYKSKTKPSKLLNNDNSVTTNSQTPNSQISNEIKKEENIHLQMTICDDVDDLSEECVSENSNSCDSDYIPEDETLPKSKKSANLGKRSSTRRTTSIKTHKINANKKEVNKEVLETPKKNKVDNNNKAIAVGNKSTRCAKKPRKNTKPLKSEKLNTDYQCPECPYMAKKNSGLREHKRRVHRTKDFTCNVCDKVFGFGKDLTRHQKSHEKPQNCCDVCGKLYKGIRSLAEHRKTHDVDYEKPEFQCDLCKKSFSTKYVLAYHIKSDHLGMKTTYLCPTCGKSFSQKHSYLQHANVHLGIRPFKCDLCDNSFTYDKSLKEHKFMHDNLRRFKCNSCDKSFRQSSALAIHARIHKEKKDYVCTSCGRGFSQKQALKRHERIHLGEKPFVCKLCSRNFTDASVLRRHMILIHKKEPKKWREDTLSLVKRAPYFIDVVGKSIDGTEKYHEEHNHSSQEEPQIVIDHIQDEEDVTIATVEENIVSIASTDSLPMNHEQVYQTENSTILTVPPILGISTQSHLPHPSYNPVPIYAHIGLGQGVYNNDHYVQNQPVNLHTLENLRPSQHSQYYPQNYHIPSAKLYEPDQQNTDI